MTSMPVGTRAKGQMQTKASGKSPAKACAGRAASSPDKAPAGQAVPSPPPPQPVTPSDDSEGSPIVDLFLNAGSDVCIRSREDLMKHISTPASADDILIALFCVMKQQRAREVVLEDKVASLTRQVSSLEEQLLRTEAYQGRNTVILGGVPESAEETPAQLEEKVLGALHLADPSIRPEHVSIMHRNRGKAGSDAPRTTTVVFTHARQKDNVMRKSGRDKLRRKNCTPSCPAKCEAHRGISAWHRLSPALADRKKELEAVPGVAWVAFSGHRMFTVCLGDNKFKHNIVHPRELGAPAQ